MKIKIHGNFKRINNYNSCPHGCGFTAELDMKINTKNSSEASAAEICTLEVFKLHVI